MVEKPLADIDFESLLNGVSGFTVGVFDRTCRYTVIYGFKDLRAVGKLVGELNTENGARVLVAAQAAVHNGTTTNFDVEYNGRVFDVRVVPIHTTHFGIVGGVVFGWDITDRIKR